jgi:hypothetical protein
MIELRSGTTVQGIILTCKKILLEYDRQCQPFSSERYQWLNWFTAPGKKGLERRNRFIMLVGMLDEQSGDEIADAARAFVKLYDFCDGDSKISRLIDLVRHYLFQLARIQLRFPSNPSAHAFAAQIAARDEELDTIAEYMRKNYCPIQDKGAIELNVLSRR